MQWFRQIGETEFIWNVVFSFCHVSDMFDEKYEAESETFTTVRCQLVKKGWGA